MIEATSYEAYPDTVVPFLRAWREQLLLAGYHLRLLNWWLFVVMALGFAGSGAVFWLEVRTGTPLAVANGNGLSLFVMEAGTGLVAGMLASFLVIGDLLLELMLTTRAGIYQVLSWRYLLTLAILAASSALYLSWTLYKGAEYTAGQGPFFFLLLWLAPVLVMSMLGLLLALMTRNATLGTVMAALPLMAALLLHDDLLGLPATTYFFIPFSYWRHGTPEWWVNRASLLVLGLLLVWGCWGWLRREERLLGNT